MIRRTSGLLVVLTLLLSTLVWAPAHAAPIGDEAFQRTWQRTDKPVANGQVSRTWMWGPEAFSGVLSEDYAESPGQERKVQYFDKSRMEITNPAGDQNSIWYVTNGLLVIELMTGKMQVGNNAFDDHAPADVNVAGDPDDPLTYADLAQRRGDAALPASSVITQRIDGNGQVTSDVGLADRGIVAQTYVGDTQHTVAAPFWAFMTSSGLVYQGDANITAPLFENAFYATGFPVTEAYWATVKIANTPREVLIQCFERRCLTYTPDNPAGWQVEAGNVGQHYHRWRYGDEQQGEQGIVTNVVDGDTIDVNLNGEIYRVRYIGIDTPEVFGGVECYGQQASAKNAELVLGKTVTLVKDVSETDVFGRLLRYVYVDGLFVNDEMVRQGYAYASTYPPDVAFADQFAAAQAEAQANGRGLWGACEVDPEPECVNLNTASFEELQLIVHIGPDRAQEIIDLRPFSSVDELDAVSGIGPTRLQEIKDEGLACV